MTTNHQKKKKKKKRVVSVELHNRSMEQNIHFWNRYIQRTLIYDITGIAGKWVKESLR